MTERTTNTVHEYVIMNPAGRTIGQKIVIVFKDEAKELEANVINFGSMIGTACTDTNKCAQCSADYCKIRKQ